MVPRCCVLLCTFSSADSEFDSNQSSCLPSTILRAFIPLRTCQPPSQQASTLHHFTRDGFYTPCRINTTNPRYLSPTKHFQLPPVAIPTRRPRCLTYSAPLPIPKAGAIRRIGT